MRGKSMVIDFRGGGIIDLDCMRRRGGGGGRRGSPGGLRLRVVMASLVDNLGNLAIQRPLHLLLGRASRMSALVITPGVFAPLHLLLAVFPPVVAIVRSPLLSHGLSLRLIIVAIGSVIGVGLDGGDLRGEALEWIEFGFHRALVRRTGTILFDGAPGQLLLLLLLLQMLLGVGLQSEVGAICVFPFRDLLVTVGGLALPIEGGLKRESSSSRGGQNVGSVEENRGVQELGGAETRRDGEESRGERGDGDGGRGDGLELGNPGPTARVVLQFGGEEG